MPRYLPTWPGLSPATALARQRTGDLPFPLSAPLQLGFYAARYGIYHLIRALCPDGETVLVPDYHHGNEVLAIRAAGANIRFYAIARNLQPDLDQIERLCRTRPRVLYVIHYLGWSQPIQQLGAICRQYDVVLVEDCALSLLSQTDGRPLGSFGDFAVFCLYKTLPVPNGGLVIQNRNRVAHLRDIPLRPCGLASVAGRSLELVLERIRSQSNGLGSALGRLKRGIGMLGDGLGRKRIPVGDTGFDWSCANLALSAFSKFLLRRLDYEAIAELRRRNYLRVLQGLRGKATLLLPTLPPGTCPLFFPVLVRDKHSAAQTLRRDGIGVVEFWNEGDPEASRGAFTCARFLRTHVLELPIHQDLRAEQLDYMLDRVERLELM